MHNTAAHELSMFFFSILPFRLRLGLIICKNNADTKGVQDDHRYMYIGSDVYRIHGYVYLK